MDNRDLISIFIPAYNVEDYLPRCLDSVVQQTYPELDIVLVDDGSVDRTGEICDEYGSVDSRINVVHQSNHGVWFARNVGQQQSKGDFLLFVDGDDYLHKDAVRIVYEAMRSSGSCDIVVFNYESPNGEIEHNSTEGLRGSITALSQEDLFKNLQLFSHVWAILYRKTLIKDIWANNYSFCEDYDYNIRVFLKAKSALWVHCPLYYYVCRSDSAIHQEGADIIGRVTQIEVLMSNLRKFPAELRHLRFYLLRELYVYFVLAINNAWETDRRNRVCIM